MSELLSVEHLSIGIRSRPRRPWLLAVEDIRLRVRTGEIVGIVGESGCGKSLTALALMGLLPPGIEVVAGSISYAGQRLDRARPRELNQIRGKDIAIVFQDPMTSLNPLLRIGTQVAEPLLLHGWHDAAKVRERVLEILTKVGLPQPEELLRAYPHQLSGGMLQRVMIATAIICKPRLLIADEPTTALDVTTQAQILQLLRHINRVQDTSILFISHDLGVINQICDRLLVMYAGSFVERGPVTSIFWHPVHEYTKGLLGSIPTRHSKGSPLANIPGRVPAVGEKTAGCAFAPRCPRASALCFSERPPELDLSETHSVKCFLNDLESEMEYARI
ncbi:MAG: ABC transporter ATP-binding protein [Coriobacteriales bacterium]|jgi:peptide/nickel transport system ATP-binding protein|nr:ABC transporter ATP-binding protein [Coriobacteriales bacterium]